MPEPIRILVVDDEEVVLQSVLKILKPDDKYEYLIDLALSAQKGLELMNATRYDIVITDLMMPGTDGITFIEMILRFDHTIRIIMITGYATMQIAAQALNVGASDFIAKPFTKVELQNAVKFAASAAVMKRRSLNRG